jgi:hypothetical protein
MASGSKNQEAALTCSEPISRSVLEMMPFLETDWKLNALWLFLHIHETLATRYLSKSKSGKRAKLNSKEAKTEIEKKGKK